MLTRSCLLSGACMTAGTKVCFSNGTKIAVVGGMSTVTGTDGAVCYTNMSMIATGSDVATGVIANGNGDTVATITFSLANSELWTVTCSGGQTATVDFKSAACQQEYPTMQSCSPGTCL
jgi:hypothetical protein